MNHKLNSTTRRWFGFAMLSLSFATLSACGGGGDDKEVPTSESHLYRSLQLLRVGMTLGDVEKIIGRAPNKVFNRVVTWTEGNESLIFSNVSGHSSDRISFLQWTWGAGKSATYTFRGADGAMPEVTAVNN